MSEDSPREAAKARIRRLEDALGKARAEIDALSADASRWPQLAGESPFGILVCRPDGSVKFANDAARRIFGLTEEDGDRKSVRAEASFFSVKDAGGRVSEVVCLLLDVSERKQARDDSRRIVSDDVPARTAAEEEPPEHQERVLQSQELDSLGALTGGIAQELNDLLRGILGNTDLALESLSPDSPAKIHLDRIEAAARRGAELADQILAYSGKGPFFLEPIRLDVGETADCGESILVADDEAAVREVTRKMLESAGFTVFVASDGKEAVEVFGRHRDDIAIVLLDMTMPHLSGEEVLRRLRELRPDIRVVLSSGHTEQDVAGCFVNDGLAGFIQKPYRTAQLLDKIREVLGSE